MPPLIFSATPTEQFPAAICVFRPLLLAQNFCCCKVKPQTSPTQRPRPLIRFALAEKQQLAIPPESVLLRTVRSCFRIRPNPQPRAHHGQLRRAIPSSILAPEASKARRPPSESERTVKNCQKGSHYLPLGKNRYITVHPTSPLPDRKDTTNR